MKKKQTFNVDLLKHAKVRSILRFLFPAVAIMVSVGIAYLFWVLVLSKVQSGTTQSQFLFNTSLVICNLFPIFLVIGLGITIPRLYKQGYVNNVALIVNIIVFCIFSILSYYVLFCFLYIFKKYISVNIDSFWTVYLIPAISFLITAAAYALLTIPNKGPVYWKGQLAIGIGTACTFIPTLILFILYILKHPMSDTGSIMRLFALVSTLPTMGFAFAINKHMLYKRDNARCIAVDAFWSANMIGGVIISVFALFLSIPIIIILMVGGGGAPVGGGGSSKDSGNNFYDKEDLSGKKYHTNSDGTLTDENGATVVPVDGGYAKI